jgi:hypothetical protein
MPHDPDRAEFAVVLQSFMNDLSDSRMIHFFMDNRSCTENSPISTRDRTNITAEVGGREGTFSICGDRK